MLLPQIPGVGTETNVEHHINQEYRFLRFEKSGFDLLLHSREKDSAKQRTGLTIGRAPRGTTVA